MFYFPALTKPARACLFLCVAFPAGSYAQTITVGVDASSYVRSVDERVFGVNAVMWDGQSGSSQTVSLLQAAGCRTIRIPGGSASDEYHWRTNTTLANTWNWAAGFHTFTQLIAGLNAQAFVTVNYGTGTPEEAAAWVAYANTGATTAGTAADVAIGTDSKSYNWQTAGVWSALRNSTPLASNDGMNFLRLNRATPLGLKYWEIGNENYGTWETDQQAVPHDPYTYAVRVKAYMAKMKAVDPTIKIGVVAVPGETANTNNTSHPATNPRTGLVRNGWTPVMLTTLKNLGVTPDYLIYHRYDQAPAVDRPGDPEGDAKLLQAAKTWPVDAADLRQQLTDYLGAVEAAKVELVVTENNSVYGKPGKQTTSLVNGLFHADSVGNLLQTEFNSLLWWDLRNGQETANNNSAALYGWRGYGDYGILSTPNSSTGTTTYYEPYPTYYAMKLLSKFTRGGDSVVRATSGSNLLSVFAARRADGSMNLLVINKDPVSTLNATIALTGHLPAAAATVFSYGKPQDDAAKPGGSGSADLASSTLAIAGPAFTASFAPYSATVLVLGASPASQTVNAGVSATLSPPVLAPNNNPPPTYRWQYNGIDLAGATNSSLVLADVQPAIAGLYTAVVTSGMATTGDPAILGVATTSKTLGAAAEVGANIVHANGNIYDQVLAQGAAATVTADPGQIVRISYVDLSDDIVQVEFSGAGTLSLVLDNPSGPATATNYNQPSVVYMKGHAGIVIAGANETTNVSIFSVGRITAVNQALFKDGVSYDGMADIAFLAISSANGRFGGIRTANTSYFAAKGLTGVYAPNVQFTGPVFVGDINASGTATPVLLLGSAVDTRITGGDLLQGNGQPVKVSGVAQLKFVAGSTSHGVVQAAQSNKAVLMRNGEDVTTQIVVNPVP